MMEIIRIGTRGSALALQQAEIFRSAFTVFVPDTRTEIVKIKTSGDIRAQEPLDLIGGKGVFVREIEKRLIDGQIDIAVHSLKDMQALLPEGLVIAAYLERNDPRDMLFSAGHQTIYTLDAGAMVGTSSLRRKCQLKQIRPDLEICDIRGNVQTRLDKIGNGVDATILAAAGIKRLGLVSGSPIDVHPMVPSPGQGTIAIQTRAADHGLNDMLAGLDHLETRICSETERTFLATLGEDCTFPVGAYARMVNGRISLHAMMGTLDCSVVRSMHMIGDTTDIGRDLAERLSREVS